MLVIDKANMTFSDTLPRHDYNPRPLTTASTKTIIPKSAIPTVSAREAHSHPIVPCSDIFVLVRFGFSALLSDFVDVGEELDEFAGAVAHCVGERVSGTMGQGGRRKGVTMTLESGGTYRWNNGRWDT